MKEINVEKIMEEIRQEIKEKGYKEDALSFQDIATPIKMSADSGFNEAELKNSIDWINSNWKLAYYMPLNSNKVIAFVKRVIRKLVKFLIYPMVEQQSEWNANVVRAINQIEKALPNSGEENERLDNVEIMIGKIQKKDLNAHKERQYELQVAYDDLRDKTNALEKENNILKEELEITKRKIEILTLRLEKMELS